MRLDRWLAEAGLGTRSEVRRLVRSGQVVVDGRVVRDPGWPVDPGQAQVCVGGRPATRAGQAWIMLHKPAGVVTATRDDRSSTVLDLIAPAHRPRGLVPVGRLDRDTTGLLLLTTDGQLAHRLTSPRWHVEKEYEALLDASVGADDVTAFAAGLTLADGSRCRPARLEPLAGPRARVTLREGRYHQVKRMFAARGRRVLALHRLRLGPLLLDADLAPGAWRPLSAAERAALYAAVGLPDPGAPGAAARP